MRGSVFEDQLFFDPEIEKTCRRLNNKTRRRRKLAKERKEIQETSTYCTVQNVEEVMVDPSPPPRGL